MNAEFWTKRARREAEQVLSAIAGRSNRAMIPAFVETVMVVTFAEPGSARMQISMDRVREAALKLSDLTPEQQNDIWQRRRQLIDRDGISDWVAQAKDKTAQDQGLSNDEITDRLLAIFFGPPNAEREAAAWSLLFGGSFQHKQHLLEHLAENRRGFLEELIGTGEIDTWLEAVLNAWKEMLIDELPDVIRDNIRLAWSETAA